MTLPLSELLARSQSLESRITEARQSDRRRALDEIRRLMSDHALTVDDVAPASKSRQPSQERRKVAPKYRDPVTGSTWTGRGLKPRWVTAALEAGKSLSDLAI